jgi:hypothetical protein
MEMEEKSPEITDKRILIYLTCFAGLVWIAAAGIFIYMLTGFSRQCYPGICGIFILVEFFYVIYAPLVLIDLWKKHLGGELFSPNKPMRRLSILTLLYIPFLYFWGIIVWMCVEKIPFE